MIACYGKEIKEKGCAYERNKPVETKQGTNVERPSEIKDIRSGEIALPNYDSLAQYYDETKLKLGEDLKAGEGLIFK